MLLGTLSVYRPLSHRLSWPVSHNL